MTISPKAKNAVSHPVPEESIQQGQLHDISPYWIFSILLVPRLLAAQYSIIGDCDEGIDQGFQKLTLQFTTTGNPPIISSTAMAFRPGNILQYMPYAAGRISQFMHL